MIRYETTEQVCPKCKAPRVAAGECPNCGVVYVKADEAARKAEEAARQKAAAQAAELEQSLKPCGHCGSRIAIAATTCPHCGGKNKRHIRHPGRAILAAVIIGIVIAVLGNMGSGNSRPADPIEAAKVVATNGCKNRLVSALRDPESLVVSSVEQDAQRNADGSYAVLTLMHYRAKNGFGGFNQESRLCEATVSQQSYIITGFKAM